MALNATDGFLKMLSRFRKGQSDAAEREAMEAWYDALDNPDVDFARESDASNKVWARIHERTGGNPLPKAGNNFRSFYRIAAAILLVCGLAGFYFMIYKKPAETAAVSGQVMHENNTAAAREVRLPDSSSVVLQPGARLSYDAGFNRVTRTVNLKGNAFFAVTRNEVIPFIVNASGIRTRVLGTEFTISERNGSAQVEVLSGKVQVQVLDQNGKPKASAEKVVLTANLKATYRPGRDALVVGLVDEPQKTAPESKSLLIFNDKPLKEVVALLEHAYGVEIRTENADIMGCPVTADLSGEPLASQLEIVTSALNAQFTVDQQGVLIRGGGCGPLPGTPHP
ncbi:FecR domain-containing protein [Dyadobacter sp. CY261]|uniref:FecR family protein n=1 Tax=Dyadobacter sp. CY261 TaxID=2907203 RepID=UPI001F2EFAA9|nr:FecR family protein [Dyadobacter sp. CY261]MCF0074081.1 FecR domain-containing protein [Dyadobacter sp. CY261]